MEDIPSINELVLYRKRREPTLAIIISCSNSEANILTEEGKQASIKNERIVLRTGIIFKDVDDISNIRRQFRRLREELQSHTETYDIKTLWECVKDSGKEHCFEELMDLYRGRSELDSKEKLQLFWAIDKDRTFFKRNKELYLPNNESDVHDALLRKERDRIKRVEKDKAVQWALLLINDKQPSQEDFDVQYYLDLVKDYIVYENSSSLTRETKQFVSEIGLKNSDEAIEFLRKAGICGKDDDQVSLKLQEYENFSNNVSEQVENILSSCNDIDNLEIIETSGIYSIDDETTEDIDDAISFSKNDGNYNVAIHITNAGYYIERGTSLDIDSMLRGESVYLPEKTINMLPPKLIDNKLSLFSGNYKPTLSLFVSFDNEYNMLDYKFKKTKVYVDENLSYENSEKIFDEQGWAVELKNLAYYLRDKRIQNNAYILQLPDFKFEINDSGGVKMKKNYMDTVSHIVISELMILINYLAAKYLTDNKIPCIYRSQTEDIEDEARNMDRTDPLFPVKVLKYLKPSRLTTRPSRHSSLGLEYYTQISSPIRRYLDIAMQRQIISFLEHGKLCYDKDELEDIIARVGSGMIDRRYAQKDRKKYWIFKFLKKERSELEGYVSTLNERRISVYIPEILMELPISRPKQELSEGDRIMLDITKIDPLRKRINLKFKHLLP